MSTGNKMPDLNNQIIEESLNPDALSKMSSSELQKNGYERTVYGVRKIVNKLTQIDISAEGILAREGLGTTESLNALLFESGNYTIVSIDSMETVTRDNIDVIEILTKDKKGDIIELIFSICYLMKDGDSIYRFSGYDTSSIDSTEILCNKIVLHEKISPDNIPVNIESMRENGEVFEDGGVYFLNGYHNNTRLD